MPFHGRLKTVSIIANGVTPRRMAKEWPGKTHCLDSMLYYTSHLNTNCCIHCTNIKNTTLKVILNTRQHQEEQQHLLFKHGGCVVA